MAVQLSVEQVEQVEELLRTVRRRTKFLVAGIIVLALALGTAIFAALSSRYDADATVRNATSIASLSQELTVEREQADSQSKIFSSFLQDFTAEEDYVCRIAAAYAARNGLEPPKPGLCAVTLPTPKPSPTPSPSSPVPPATRATASPTRAPSTPQPTTVPTAAPTAIPTPTPLLNLPLPSLPILGPSHSDKTRCAPVGSVLALLTKHRKCH